jgi:putative membrane protein
MRSYNPKQWTKFISDFQRTDGMRQLLPVLVFTGIYSGFLDFLELNYFSDDLKDHLENLSIIHNLLGFVLSMLLVFRTNTAYDRCGKEENYGVLR